MKKANIVTSVICMALGAYIIYTAMGFPPNNSAVDPGAAYFPTLMAGLLILLSIALIAATVMGKAEGLEETFGITPGIKRAGIGMLLFILYSLLFKKAGFVIDTIWFCFVTMYLLKNRKYVQMGIISVATAVVIYYVFAVLLGAKLPAGLLKGIL